MILDKRLAPMDDLGDVWGWEVKPVGACKDDRCVPLPARTDDQVDVVDLAQRLGMAVAHDEEHGLWAIGPAGGGRFLDSAVCPEIVLPDLDGNDFAVSSLRGKKVLLVTWASWCGCRHDLPGWQQLREELGPQGFEVVTVAMDSGGPDGPRPYHEVAGTTHPALVDTGHVLDALLGVVNVPTGVWIDEDGMLVRPPEAAAPQTMLEMLPNITYPEGTPDRVWQMLEESHKIRVYSERYVPALRDWVEKGEASEYALSPDEVVRRSQPRSADVAMAAASFELGEHFHRTGAEDASVRWFRDAHRLQPDNWTYRRQAWYFADPLRIGPTEGAEDEWPYEGDWLTDARKIGAENYYPPPDL
jgi:peroxiredoxin